LEISVPHISGAVRTFQSGTTQQAVEWAMLQVETEHPAVLAPFPIVIRRPTDDSQCLHVFVRCHKILRCTPGLHLGAADAKSLEVCATRVVAAIKAHSERNPGSLGDWSKLLDSVFGCYRLRLLLDSESSHVAVADVQGHDSPYDPSMCTMSVLQTTGLVGYGGHK
jgi:hypothetical protein